MESVLEKYGLRTKRGFCKCPFHSGDNTPSMKVYKDGYHCYGCGANGDVFTFVQNYEGVDFKTAFKILGGQYQHSFKEFRKIDAARARREREEREHKEKLIYKKDLAEKITLFRRALKILDSSSEEYWYVWTKLQIILAEWEEVDY